MGPDPLSLPQSSSKVLIQLYAWRRGCGYIRSAGVVVVSAADTLVSVENIVVVVVAETIVAIYTLVVVVENIGLVVVETMIVAKKSL